MGNVTLTVRNIGRLEKQPGAKYEGNNPQVLFGEIAMSTSYAASGDTLDLSAYFSEVDEVIIGSAQGCSLDYVAGATVATSKVKAYGALTAHTHSLKVVGGADAANQWPVMIDTATSILQKAKKLVIAGSTAGPASYPTGGFTLDLSSNLNGIPDAVLVGTEDRQDQIAIYDKGTGANDGKIVVTVASTGAEVANTTNLSAINYQYIARGDATNTTDVTATGGTDNVQNSAETATASEVDAATNLSTITATIVVVGKPA